LTSLHIKYDTNNSTALINYLTEPALENLTKTKVFPSPFSLLHLTVLWMDSRTLHPPARHPTVFAGGSCLVIMSEFIVAAVHCPQEPTLYPGLCA